MDTNKIKKKPISKDEMKKSQEKYKVKDDPLIFNFEKAELIKLIDKIDSSYVVFVLGESLDPKDQKKAIIYLRVPETKDGLITTYSYYPSNLCPPPHGCNLDKN
jgi:hypothetical protein